METSWHISAVCTWTQSGTVVSLSIHIVRWATIARLRQLLAVPSYLPASPSDLENFPVIFRMLSKLQHIYVCVSDH